MVVLSLKILGMGLAGDAITYGAYIGIREDMKWKASTDYPAYYWNKYYRGNLNCQKNNVMLNYKDKEEWKFLYNYRKLSFWWKKGKSTDTHAMETSSVSSDEITKAKNGVTSDSDAINTLLKDVDSNWESRKDEDKFKNLSEEWKKYRELCVIILREFVMNSQKSWKSTLEDKCLFNANIKNDFDSFKSKNTDYGSISTDTDYWEKITTFKTPSSK